MAFANLSSFNSTNFTRTCDLEIYDVVKWPAVQCENVTKCELEWPCEILHYMDEDLTVIRETVTELLRYGTLVTIIMGLLLNALSFYVLQSSGLAKNASGIYLMALAVCDSGNLVLNFGVGIGRSAFYDVNDVFMEHEWVCRVHSVFVELFQLTTAWIVVAFTIERFLIIWWPMTIIKSKIKRSKVILMGICLACVAMSLTKFFLSGFEGDSVFGYTPCGTHTYKWGGVGYIRIALQTWFPTVAIFVFNCLIFLKLEKAKNDRKHLQGYRDTFNRVGSLQNEKPSHSRASNRTTPMLIAVSLAYLVLVLPLGLVQTTEFYWSSTEPVITDRAAYIEWKKTKLMLKHIRCVCFSFYQINFCINFFLYFVTGVQFRTHLLSKLAKLKGCCCPAWIFSRQGSETSNTSARTVETVCNSESGSYISRADRYNRMEYNQRFVMHHHR